MCLHGSLHMPLRGVQRRSHLVPEAISYQQQRLRMLVIIPRFLHTLRFKQGISASTKASLDRKGLLRATSDGARRYYRASHPEQSRYPKALDTLIYFQIRHAHRGRKGLHPAAGVVVPRQSPCYLTLCFFASLPGVHVDQQRSNHKKRPQLSV